MKKEINNIDKLFANGLKNHSVTPPEKGWEKVAAGLGASKSTKVVPLFFLKYAAIFLGLFFALWIVFSLFENEPEIAENHLFPEQQIVKGNQESINHSFDRKMDNHSVAAKTNPELEKVVTAEVLETPKNQIVETVTVKKTGLPSEKQFSDTFLTSQIHERQEDKFFINKLTPIIAYLKQRMDFSVYKQLSESRLHSLLNKEKTRYALLNHNTSQSLDKEAKGKKWQLGVNVAPVYAYRSTNSAYMSDVIPQSDNSKKLNAGSYENPILTYAAGISTQYHVHKKWTIETGVYYSRLGHTKGHLIYNPDEEDLSFYANTSAGYVDSKKLPANLVISEQEVAENHGDYIAKSTPDTRLNQYFDFMEIPFVIRYRVLESALNISLLGGVNTAFMVDNKASFEIENHSVALGETKNMRSMLYSSIIGVGFQYELTPKIALTMDPSFKYALHSLSKDNQFVYQPFSFNLLTGIHLNF